MISPLNVTAPSEVPVVSISIYFVRYVSLLTITLPPLVVMLAPNVIFSSPELSESDVRFKLKALFVAVMEDAFVNCKLAAVLIVNVASLPEVFTMLPEKIRSPVVIILAVATVLISPDKVRDPAELIAPALLIPVPEILISSAMDNPVAIVN